MSRIPLAALLILVLAVAALAQNSNTTTTTTVRAHLKHVAKLNSLINALQDATKGSTRPAARNRTAASRPTKRPGGIKALEAQDGVARQAAAELNYTIVGLNETTLAELPSLVNQTELGNSTNTSEPTPPPTGEESNEGFFGFVRKVFKAVTSIDRYTLILTCAFVFGVVLIAVLIFIAICVCKRFGNRTPVKQQKYDEIGLKSPATSKRGKPKSKLDFLDESKPFMETNLDAAAASPSKSLGVEEAPAPAEDDAETQPSPPAGPPPPDSPARPQEVVVSSPQPPPTPKKESSLSKISLNIAASLSSLNQKTAGIFAKNTAAAASSKDSNASSKRQSIISAKIPAGARSHRISLGASQSSLVNQQPVNFAIVSDDIDFLFKQSAPSQPDLTRASQAALDSPVRHVAAAPDSLANSVSDIYRQAIVEKREGQAKLKKTKSNSMMSPKAAAGAAMAAEISFNPGVADAVSFLSESEKSCY